VCVLFARRGINEMSLFLAAVFNCGSWSLELEAKFFFEDDLSKQVVLHCKVESVDFQ